MIIRLNRNTTVGELQNVFSATYPFLKLEVYRRTIGQAELAGRTNLLKTTLLYSAGNQQEGELEMTDSMTVGQLEHSFRERFGIFVQVCRKSGPVWLETTMTDKWTLKQQNEHGRELSEPLVRVLPDRDLADDQ